MSKLSTKTWPDLFENSASFYPTVFYHRLFAIVPGTQRCFLPDFLHQQTIIILDGFAFFAEHPHKLTLTFHCSLLKYSPGILAGRCGDPNLSPTSTYQRAREYTTRKL